MAPNDTDDVTEEPEIDQKIERTDVGVSITTKVTRGTGTRDQEEFRAKVKARDMDEAETMQARMLIDLDEWAAEARDIQPDADDAGDD